MSARSEREERTLEAMLLLYCRGHHEPQGALCDDCRELLLYTKARLERCLFHERKPTCARCPVPCYRPTSRQRVRDIMRYAGPRMVVRHPLLTLLHWVDGLRKIQ